MVRLSLSRNAERRKRIVAVLTVWLEMCTTASLILCLLSSVASSSSYGPSLDAILLIFMQINRDYVRRIVRDNDNSCVSLIGMNRLAKSKSNINEMGEPISAETITSAAMLLGDSIKEVGREFSSSIGAEMMILQRAKELYGAYSALGEIEGLTEDERDIALSKIPDHFYQMLAFFSLAPTQRLTWVLATH